MDVMFVRCVHIQGCQLQRCDGEEVKNHEPAQEQVHHPRCQARGRLYGLGLLQGKSWQEKPVLSAQEQDHERQEVKFGYGGEPDPLHELSQSKDLYAGWHPLPQEQDCDGGTEEGEDFNTGLALELFQLERQRELLVAHEEEAESGPHHHLRPQDNAGNQEDVGPRYVLLLLQRAVGW
jgi:hypothetical protein